MGYINSKNDQFSTKPESGFFVQGVDAVKGQFGRFKDIVTNPLTYTSDLENARDAEGDVFINGRRVAGIFQGFQIRGGVFTEKFDQKKYRNKLVDLPKGAQLFQIDKGVRPITGSASFVLLDDPYSTALEKSKEFVRMVTHWEDGETAQQNVKRVFRIKSFLIGVDRAFNFSTVKIPNYNLDMSNIVEGKIGASFQFEQFEIFQDEFKSRKPKTTVDGEDAGLQIESLTVDLNPFAETVEIPK